LSDVPCAVSSIGDTRNNTISCNYGVTPEQIKELIIAAAKGAADPLEERLSAISSKLGLTEEATRALLRSVGQADVPDEKLNEQIALVARDYKRLQAQIAAMTPEDPEARELSKKAMSEIDAGHANVARELLRRANEVQYTADQRIPPLFTRFKAWIGTLRSYEIATGIIGFLTAGWTLTLALLYWLDPARLVIWHERFPKAEEANATAKALDKITFGGAAILSWLARAYLWAPASAL
jgi:hypothetical protein